MKFVRYNSIENSYRSKFIDRFSTIVDFNKLQLVMLEKIHGANLQIMIDEEGEVKFCSRNNVLPDDANFQNGLIEAKGKLDLRPVINFCEAHKTSIRLFGELCGDGIQKGVHYFKDKRILFFDMVVDGKYVDFNTFEIYMKFFNLPMVPIVKREILLEDALSIDVDSFISMVSDEPIEDNIAEGFVIRPMYKEVWSGEKRFILKYKSKKHSEKSQRKKKQHTFDPVVDEWRNKILEYVTENRLLNIFSKEGTIESPKQIGEYIGYFMADVAEDFNKDYPEFKELEISKNQKKRIMNYQAEIVKMLHKYM